jgi:nucleoside 2-deoxyribosyltransferase
MLIYLAGSIWGTDVGDVFDWRERVEHALGRDNCLNPLRRGYTPEDVLNSIGEVVVMDKYDIRRSDAILVNHKYPSVGTSMEVFFAWTLGKPVIVVNQSGKVLPPWLTYHSTVVFEDFPAAFSWIRGHIA